MKSIKDIPSLLSTLEFLDRCGAGEPVLETPLPKYQMLLQTAKALFPRVEAVMAPHPLPLATNIDIPKSLPRKVAPDLKKMDHHVAEAVALASGAKSLDQLKAILETFDGCALKHTATTTVFADGNPDADMMLIGEAPGADEDRQGLPFVGASGQLLDRMLAAIGRTRQEHFYVANIIPWRPPGNRPPTVEETKVCLPFIHRQIALKAPKVILCIGATAAHALLQNKEGMSQLRGKWFPYTCGAMDIPTTVLFHPAYLIRSPSHKKHAWEDLLKIQRYLKG